MAESTVMSEEQRKQHIVQMKKLLERHWGNPAFLNMDGLKNLEDQEKFLEHILSIEGIDEEPLFDQLENRGIRLTPPEELDDTQLHEKLWEIINAMAMAGHYLSSTDHLSDRQLYELLWSNILREPTSVFTDSSASFSHIDILGGCSDEDLKIRLKYYADDDERACWESDFPEDEIPPKEPLPFDRDRHLPEPACCRAHLP